MQSIQAVPTAMYCLAIPQNYFAAKVPFLPVIGIRPTKTIPAFSNKTDQKAQIPAYETMHW
jgi:hypothetical protein